MIRKRSSTLLFSILTCVTAGCGSTTSDARDSAIDFHPCSQAEINQYVGSSSLECGRFTVPVDYANPTNQTFSLAVARQQATHSAEHTRAIFTFSGGPGGASIPFATETGTLLRDVLDTHDFVTFDQRGTGNSQPLSCPEISRVFGSANQAEQRAVQRCRERLGGNANLYGTRESVEDIERLRSALGYEKIALYGVSYGTYLVQRYAARYPERVERVILDSPIPAAGSDPWKRSVFQAFLRVLGTLCKRNDCRYATTNVKRDFMRVANRLRRRPINGFVIDGRGKKQQAKITSAGFFQTLLGEDLDPALRAQLPAALGAAAQNDFLPLLRLQYQAFRYFTGGSSQNPLQINHGLYVATRCADGPFPWQQTAGTKERLAQAQSALGQIPAKAFYPFPASTAFQAGDLFRCATWPATTPPPAEQTPVVPTLVLSGELDLRTPNEDARKIAEATLITIPNVGHSSLYADTSGCARQALTAFIDNQQPQPCPASSATSNSLFIAARPPRSVSATAPLTKANTFADRAASAALLTLFDARYQISAALTTLNATPQIGGLRGGKLRLANDWLVKTYAGITPQAKLQGFTFVPKLAISGIMPGYGNGKAKVEISGAARGNLFVTFHDATVTVNGTVNKRHVKAQITYSGDLRNITTKTPNKHLF